MKQFNARSIDLNLLSVFVVLWDTRSVSRTSERLALTQPAISHALRRLRDRLGDQLFVSGRNGLVPTARAVELINPVRQALGEIHRVIEDAPTFQPARDQREFRIALLDLVEFWLLPTLLEQMRKDAPGVVVRPVPVPDINVAHALLEAGDINAIIDTQSISGGGVRCESLSELKLVTLIWKQEKVRKGRFPLRLFLERPHVLFQQRDRAGGVIDQKLSARGLKRKIGAIVQNMLTMPAVASQTGYVCNVPDLIASRFADVFELSVHQPPIDFPPLSLFCAWHARFEADPAQAWLLAKIRGALVEIKKRTN